MSYTDESSASTNATKCEYTCDSGYTKQDNSCVPLTCAGQKPANAVMCKNIVKAENFVPIKTGYLKAGFWRFDTFEPLPTTYKVSDLYLA